MPDTPDVDELRERVAENPGLDMVEEDDVPAYFDEDKRNAEGGITKTEAEAQASDDHQGHAPG